MMDRKTAIDESIKGLIASLKTAITYLDDLVAALPQEGEDDSLHDLVEGRHTKRSEASPSSSEIPGDKRGVMVYDTSKDMKIRINLADLSDAVREGVKVAQEMKEFYQVYLESDVFRLITSQKVMEELRRRRQKG